MAWQRRKQTYERRDHQQEITDRIVAALEAGTKPWQRPWVAGQGGGAPVNAVTGARYRGINVLLLTMAAFAFGHDPRFCSYRQAAAKGWQVRGGERGTTVFFYKTRVVADPAAGETTDDHAADPAARRIPLARAYTVFNGSQIDGIPPWVPPEAEAQTWRRPEATEIILRNSGAVVRTGGSRAYYAPSADLIQMPDDRCFFTAEGWNATVCHELGHWSGAKHRLDRDLSGRFGSAAYAQEELRAELASAFMGAELGLPTDIPGHASYIDSWIEVLRRDKHEVFRAAADAQRIADYLLAFHPDFPKATGETGDDAADGSEAADGSDAAGAGTEEGDRARRTTVIADAALAYAEAA